MQKTKPILFTGEMVRAIRDGRKTQTRRVIKPQPEEKPHGWPCPEGHGLAWYWKEEYIGAPVNLKDNCPYGVVGDRLWVREAFGIFDVDADEDIAICYKADNSDAEWFKNKRQDFNELRIGKWRSPFHLHKWATRLWLEITGIRVERVKDISWQDCKAEGITLIGDELVFNNQKQKQSLMKTKFQRLWDSINAKRGYGWEVNPYNWVVEFREVQDGD